MPHTPNDLFYTNSHEWVKPQADGSLLVGITDHAQCLLGDIVFVELPAVEKSLSAGKECVVLESVKAAADVYAPVSGKILEINENLQSQPELINQSPYENGWIFKMQPQDPKAHETLLSAEAYQSQIS